MSQQAEARKPERASALSVFSLGKPLFLSLRPLCPVVISLLPNPFGKSYRLEEAYKPMPATSY